MSSAYILALVTMVCSVTLLTRAMPDARRAMLHTVDQFIPNPSDYVGRVMLSEAKNPGFIAKQSTEKRINWALSRAWMPLRDQRNTNACEVQ